MGPITGFTSFVRQSRMFHPRGSVYRAEVEPLAESGAASAVAARLSGAALLRFSGAWWKGREWRDVLGCALRFSVSPLQELPRPGDQDLLFATVRRPWTLCLAPFTTRVNDYLANDFYAVSPFRVPELGLIEWRLAPEAPSPVLKGREERLRAAVQNGAALLSLEWAPYRKPWQILDERSFQPLARIRLCEALELDQERLRFDPQRAERGIEPVGERWLT